MYYNFDCISYFIIGKDCIFDIVFMVICGL